MLFAEMPSDKNRLEVYANISEGERGIGWNSYALTAINPRVVSPNAVAV